MLHFRVQNSMINHLIAKKFYFDYFRTIDNNSGKNRKWENLAITGALGRNSKNKRKRRMDQVIMTKINFNCENYHD